MNVLFCWTGLTPAMVACWRAFASQADVRFKLLTELPRKTDTAFDAAALLHGLDACCRFADEPLDRGALEHDVRSFAPDLIVVLGWRSPMCRAVAENPAFANVPKLFAFDMTFAWSLRKLAAPFVLRRYLRRFAGAFVTGKRSAAYARFLGFPEGRIETGLIGLDAEAYALARRERPERDRHPRQFLYVGRYSREKRIDLLVEAYGRYRASVADPWGLTCAGMGPHASLLNGRPGVTDLGFVQPSAMPELLARHGCLAIASDYDPWPLVIAEACASGMPVVCTDACGSHAEFVQPGRNGIVCKTGSATSVAEGLRWIHDHAADLPEMGRSGLATVAPYAAEAWATRFRALCDRVAVIPSPSAIGSP
jgi:glycosyltransferase involved in cell wall biosynthesis